jgi:cysteine-rich repeat protein
MSCIPVCGDGIFLDTFEECDDNNLELGDGCDNLCTVEPDF